MGPKRICAACKKELPPGDEHLIPPPGAPKRIICIVLTNLLDGV